MAKALTSKTNSILVEFRDDDIWGHGNDVLDQYIFLLKQPGGIIWASTEENNHAKKVLSRLKSFSPNGLA